jgi:sugar phosphate isomerase/epimerase
MTWSIGASTGVCVDRPILDVLDAVARSGVRGVELGTPPRHFDPWQEAQIQLVRERLQRSGVQAVSIHAPFGGLLDLSDANPHHRHAAVGGILATASALKRVGGTLVIVHTTDVPRQPREVDERLSRCAESLVVLAHACRHMGLTLVVETPLPHLVGGHPDEFTWLLGRLDHEVGICLDTGHTALGRNWQRFVDLAGDRLAHVHAHDNHGTFDDHLPPGDGVLDWKEIAASLRRIDYRGWVMLELKCPNEPLDGYFARAQARAKQLLA